MSTRFWNPYRLGPWIVVLLLVAAMTAALVLFGDSSAGGVLKDALRGIGVGVLIWVFTACSGSARRSCFGGTRSQRKVLSQDA